jgi:hypothetical protein
VSISIFEFRHREEPELERRFGKSIQNIEREQPRLSRRFTETQKRFPKAAVEGKIRI